MSGKTPPHIVVLTTLANPEQARGLVRKLLGARLVACGTLIPGAVSVYRWQGEVTEETETLVILKTRVECWERLRECVEQEHPYDVPELLALPVEAGLSKYLSWVTEQTIES